MPGAVPGGTLPGPYPGHPMPVSARLLLVEDDPRIGSAVAGQFEALGHAVEWARDGAEGLGRFGAARDAGDPFALVLLDLTLPSLDGLDVLGRLRTTDALTPVLILSARVAKLDVVRGLELGADDYVSKPFDAAELAARVQGLLRRAGADRHAAPPGDALVQRGALRIDPTQWRVSLDGRDVALTPKEFELLLLLARHPGRPFSRDELLETLWGTDFDGYGHTVNTHINRLRRKVEVDPANPTCIETVWGVGYRFADADGRP